MKKLVKQVHSVITRTSSKKSPFCDHSNIYEKTCKTSPFCDHSNINEKTY